METLPDKVKKIPIELVDSHSASIGMAPAILQAAREPREGLELEEIKVHLLDLLSRTQFLGVLDTVARSATFMNQRSLSTQS